MQLPDWLPIEIWQEWIDYRQQDKKKPASERSQRMTINKLERLREEGYCPIKLIERAIEMEWQGIYAHEDCKRETHKATGEKLSAVERFRRANGARPRFGIVGGDG